MNTGNQTTEMNLVLPREAAAGGQGTEFVLATPPAAGRQLARGRQWLLALLAVVVLVLLGTGWSILHAWPTYSDRGQIAVAGLLGLCLSTLGLAAGTMIHGRRVQEESQRLATANTRLLEERDLLHTIIDVLPDFIYAKDRQGRFVLNNPAHARDLGASSPAEMKGKSDFDYFPPELAKQFFNDEQQIIATGEPVINQEQYKARPGSASGEKVWSLSSKVLWRDRQGNILGTAGVTRNIHEFKLTQEALRRTEERLRAVLRRTRCIIASGTVEAPVDWREHALDEQSPFTWNFPVQNAEGAQEVCPLEVKHGQTYRDAWVASRNPEDDRQMNQNSGQALLHDLPYYRNEFRCTDKHGVEHWMQQMVTVEKVAERRWRIFGITSDITDLKRSEQKLRLSDEELRRSTAQLKLSNRELQDFAYVASHDLQEPLRKIVVFGERLKEKCGETLPPEPRDYLERIQKSACRMQTLINDLLAFSRLTTRTNPFAPVKLTEIGREVIEDLESRIEQVQGRVIIGELPVIEADALQMRQLLQNLIGNALKFRRPDTAPVVQVAGRLFTDVGGLSQCVLTVADNGIGFEEKYLDRIFNVFQRLHSRSEYEGTGMGLAIVRKIALHHGGEVTARSQPDQGATFIVTLPVTQNRTKENQAKEKP
jgi:PAS domain S-box-containing protein